MARNVEAEWLGVPGRSHRPDRPLNGAHREDPDEVDVRVDASGGGGDERVAVGASVRGIEGPGQAVVAALGDEQAVGLVEPAFVATTPMVVFSTAPLRPPSGGGGGQLGSLPSSMSPTALTATSAATTRSPSPDVAPPSAAGPRVLAAAPLPDGRAGAGAERPTCTSASPPRHSQAA